MKYLLLLLGASCTNLVQLMKSKYRDVVQNERGDVPGWVLITVMTAGLVVGLWSIAGPQLKTVLTNAIHSVTTP